MSQWQCPLCGKFNSIDLYDPSNFEEDILIIKFRGLGRGKGFEIVDKYSLLNGSDPGLLNLISDRVAILYDMLYEDVEEGEAEADLEDEEDYESLSELEKELRIVEAEDEKYLSDVDEEVIE